MMMMSAAGLLARAASSDAGPPLTTLTLFDKVRNAPPGSVWRLQLFVWGLNIHDVARLVFLLLFLFNKLLMS